MTQRKLKKELADNRNRESASRWRKRYSAKVKGIDPLSLEATSPLTVEWMKKK